MACTRASSSSTRWPPCFPVAPVTSTVNLSDMSFSLSSYARSFLKQPLGQKGSDCLECLSSCGEFAYTGDESVRHSHPYVQLGVHTRRDGARHVTARAVEQHFVVSNGHADWRQPPHLTDTRRPQE